MNIIAFLHKIIELFKKLYFLIFPKPKVVVEESEHILEKKILLATLANTAGIGHHGLRGIYPILDLDFRTLTPIQIVARLPYNLHNKELIANELHTPNYKLRERIKKRYFAYKNSGTQFIIDKENKFPGHLRNLEQRPYWIFVQGDASLLQLENIIAIIGTRKPSPWSLEITQCLTEYLVSKGFIILAGLAPGIDFMAHITTVKKGGKTIAVLGHGVEEKLSYTSLRLRDEIIEAGGTIVTEYFPRVSYSRKNFVLRNRIQTALSHAVIPIECKKHSGTMHTINYALAQKKKLFTIIYKGVKEKQNDIYQIMKLNSKPIFEIPRDYNTMLNHITNREGEVGQKEKDSQLALDL